MGIAYKLTQSKSSPFLGKLAIALLFFLLMCSFFLPPFLPHDFYQADLTHLFLPPLTKGHILGTNEFGRDMLSGLLYGLRTSFFVSFVSTFFAFLIGNFLGLLAAVKGSWVDVFLSRFIELQLSIPSFLIALLLIAFFGAGTLPLIVALVIGQWPYFAQITRNMAKIEITQEYILASRILGRSSFFIATRHLWPNLLPPQIVVFSYQLARGIALESALSFLGVGIKLTDASLGIFIAQGYVYFLSKAWWISFFPGLLLIFLVMIITKIGDYFNLIYGHYD